MPCPIFQAIKSAKDADKHLIIIDALIDNGILFIEQGEQIYQIIDKSDDIVTWFTRTNVLRFVAYGKTNDIKLTSFKQLADFF